LEKYRLLQERQPEIGGALSCQRMLVFLFSAMKQQLTDEPKRDNEIYPFWRHSKFELFLYELCTVCS